MIDRQRPITGEMLSVAGRGRRARNDSLTADDVGRVFRALADEHIAAVNGHADHESLWARVGGRDALFALPAQRAGGWKAVRISAGPRNALLAALTGLSALSFAMLHERWSAPESPPSSLSFIVSDNGLTGQSGARTLPVETGGSQLIASETDPMHVELSDEGVIDLEPHTTLRLSGALAPASQPIRKGSGLKETKKAKGGVGASRLPNVQARIAQGKIRVHVPQTESKRYRFHAGPYLVTMIGTAFTLEYQPQDDELRLEDVVGEVEVSTPRGPHRLVSGQSLHLTHLVPVDSDGEGPVDPDDVRTDQNSRPVAEQAPLKTDPRPTAVSPASTEDFVKLGAQGQFKTIVTIARKRGVSQVLGTHAAPQLQELAQAARYTGQLALAEKTWQTMRQRFTGQPLAVNAGFFLGRLAEQRGQHSTALAHFETYLRESPRGVYAAEAWGRKLQVTQSTNGPEAAQGVARQYLQRYPAGAYAKTARALLRDE